MTTNAEISAAITDAETLDVLPAQMVALIDRAIAAAHVAGLAVINYSINGRSRTVSLDAALNMRKYYANLASAGGVIFQPAEFSPEIPVYRNPIQ